MGFIFMLMFLLLICGVCAMIADAIDAKHKDEDTGDDAGVNIF